MARRQDRTKTATRTRGTLTRAEIAVVATDFIERAGIARLTMRALATELDCGTMTLYSHVKNREDLLAAVIEHLIIEINVPAILARPHPTWQELISELHGSYRDLAGRFPRSFELLALAPWDLQPVSVHLHSMVASLEPLGLSHKDAVTAIRVSDSYATGYLLVHARRASADETPSTKNSHSVDFEDGLRIVLAGLTSELQIGRG